jgi:hypothetical protein
MGDEQEQMVILPILVLDRERNSISSDSAPSPPIIA